MVYFLLVECYGHVFQKHVAGEAGFNLSGTARLAYREHGWDGCKFVEKKVEEKAA